MPTTHVHRPPRAAPGVRKAGLEPTAGEVARRARAEGFAPPVRRERPAYPA